MRINRIVLVAASAALIHSGLAAPVSAGKTFSASIAMNTGFGLPIPILQPIPGGTACPPADNCKTQIVNTLATSDEPLVIPKRAFRLTTGPNVFPLPQPTSYPFLTTTTSATFSNTRGTVSKGGGPGSLTWCPGLGVGPCTGNQGTRPGRFRVDQVGEQFGGVMRLAGVFNDVLNISSPPGKLHGPLPIPLSNLGGPLGTTVTGVGTLTHTVQGFTTMFYATVTFLPWTTARFRVDDANVGAGPEAPITVTGYDMRNATGAGSIQLVSGWLAHISGLFGDDTTGQATMTLNLPEPRSTLMLASGLSLLFGLYRFARRR